MKYTRTKAKDLNLRGTIISVDRKLILSALISYGGGMGGVSKTEYGIQGKSTDEYIILHDIFGDENSSPKELNRRWVVVTEEMNVWEVLYTNTLNETILLGIVLPTDTLLNIICGNVNSNLQNFDKVICHERVNVNEEVMEEVMEEVIKASLKEDQK